MYIMYVATEHQKYETYFASLLGAVSWHRKKKYRCFQARANAGKSENLLVSLQNVAQSWGHSPILIFYTWNLPHGVYLFIYLYIHICIYIYFFLHEKLCSLCFCVHSTDYVTSFQGSHTVWERGNLSRVYNSCSLVPRLLRSGTRY